jgi:hypothetical protein
MPSVRARFPNPAEAPDSNPDTWTPSQRIHASYHDWSPDLPEIMTDLYPSHLHIDIVARGQVRAAFECLLLSGQLCSLTTVA